MTHVDAAHLARDLGGPVVLPMHFWTFADHNGDPGAFLDACQHFAPQARPLLLRPGECYVARKEQGA
jgi:L-ascorbate metabolism protein UlaG (beta-lactamase superfamily)